MRLIQRRQCANQPRAEVDVHTAISEPGVSFFTEFKKYAKTRMIVARARILECANTSGFDIFSDRVAQRDGILRKFHGISQVAVAGGLSKIGIRWSSSMIFGVVALKLVPQGFPFFMIIHGFSRNESQGLETIEGS